MQFIAPAMWSCQIAVIGLSQHHRSRQSHSIV
jgi:hypothetical protein